MENDESPQDQVSELGYGQQKLLVEAYVRQEEYFMGLMDNEGNIIKVSDAGKEMAKYLLKQERWQRYADKIRGEIAKHETKH